MKRLTTFIYLFAFVFLICSCRSDNNAGNDKESEESEQTDAQLTPEETLSTSLVQGILGIEDEDLESFIESELYSEIKSGSKVAIDRLSSSVFMIEFEKSGSRKAYIVRKYYDPSKEEFLFEKSVVDSDILKQVIR